MSHYPTQKTKFDGIVDIFSYLVKEKVYGPVDRLARAVDPDMVRTALYEALRYVSTEQRKGAQITLPDENEIQEFLEAIEKQGVGIARKIAIRSLTRGLTKESIKT